MSEKILTLKVIYDDRSTMFEILSKVVYELCNNEDEGFYSKNNCQASFQTHELESEIEKIKNVLLKNKSIFQEGNIGTIGENKCILLKSKFD